MMNDNKDMSLPCDPASARRSPVPGLEGVKNATEGGGGVGPQAPPSANAPGANTTVAALSPSSVASASGGPVLSTRKKRKNPKKRKTIKNRKAEDEAVARYSAPVLGVGGQGTTESSAPRGPQPEVSTNRTTSQHQSWKQQRKERRQRDEELMSLVLNQRVLEGTIHPSGVSALSPAVGAIFARPTNSKLVGTPPPMPRCEPNHLLYAPGPDRSSEFVSYTAGPSSAGCAAPRQREGEPFYTNDSKTGTMPTAVNSGASEVSSSASRDGGPTIQPKPHKGKGKGKGKAVPGGHLDLPVIPASSAPTTPGNTRGAKRQRSSDLVSPSTAVADKKVRMETSSKSSVIVASSEGHIIKDGTGVASYAEAARSHLKVVILDKAGANFTELQAAIIRRELEDRFMAYFLQMRQGTSEFHTLQRLNFGALPRLFRGGLRVEAKDEYSLNWLTTLVNNLPGKWPGSGGYRVVAEHELPAFLKGTIYVPDLVGNASDVREFLSFCNDTETLRIRNWQIFVHNIIRTSTMQHNVKVFGIPAEDEPELRRMDCRLRYKIGSVHILLRKPRAGDVRNAIDAPAAAASTCESMDAVETEAPIVVNVPCPEESDLTAEIDRVIQAMAGGGGEAGEDLSCLSLNSPAADMSDDLPESVGSSLPPQ